MKPQPPVEPVCGTLICRAIALLISAICSSCTFVDQEYSQKLVHAQTNWTGKEITGVWVSKLNYLAMESRNVLLLRSDGTGIWRTSGTDRKGRWSYAGQGVWKGNFSFINCNFRYTGRELLADSSGLGTTVQFVFVPSDDSGAVEKHLRARD